MKKHSKSSYALASVMAMILAVPGGAWADEGRYGNDWHKGGNGGANEHYNTHYNNHYNNHYNGSYSGYYHGPYKGGSYYYPYYGCSTCGNNNHHNNNNNNDKLWIGLLGGGILGYALNAYQHSHSADQGYYPPVSTAPPPPTVARYETPYTGYAGNTCLQEREYRTKIMVGGKQVEGYGTACLQPDGSWRYGPAQAGSY